MLKRVACVLLAVFAIHPALAAPPFAFTAIPDADDTRLAARFGKVADYLSARLGVQVRYFPVKSYAAAISAFRSDQVQLAWFGGFTGVQARRLVPGARAIAQGVEDARFRSYFIAHTSTGLKRAGTLPDAIRGMTFTFGARTSTSGRLMPEYYLRRRFGMPPGKLFRRVGFSGNHSRSIALVQAGAYQLGAVNYEVWNAAKAAGRIDPDKVRVIWQTPAYTDYQWTIRGDVDHTWGRGFSARVQRVLLDLHDPDVLATFPRSGFIPAANADYRAIAEAASAIGLLD